tara:strand:+ start:8076 stop:8663 length:588 start_codon:yes stop_codon:yes gene_type:complete
MPKVKQIVSVLNDRLTANKLAGHLYQRGTFYGLAVQERKEVDANSANDYLIPVVYNNGKTTDVTIDNTNTFQIYHRILSVNYGPSKEFGPLNESTYQMVAIVFYDKERINIDADDLSYLIRCDIDKPLTKNELGTSNLASVGSLVTGANLNSYQVMSSEFTNADYRLESNGTLFSINYTIRVTSQPSCINCTDCD